MLKGDNFQFQLFYDPDHLYLLFQISLDKFNVSRVHGHLVERGIHGDPVSQVGFGPRMIVEFLSAVNQPDGYQSIKSEYTEREEGKSGSILE